MRPPLITVDLIVNNIVNAIALINYGCLYYTLINKRFAYRHYLERFQIPSRIIEGVNGKLSEINEVARFSFKLHGYEETAYAYVIDLSLGADISWQGVDGSPRRVSSPRKKEHFYPLEGHLSKVN